MKRYYSEVVNREIRRNGSKRDDERQKTLKSIDNITKATVPEVTTRYIRVPEVPGSVQVITGSIRGDLHTISN